MFGDSCKTECDKCGVKDHHRYLREDYDYDGNDRIWTWNVYYCEHCKSTFNVPTNDPYEDEESDSTWL